MVHVYLHISRRCSLLDHLHLSTPHPELLDTPLLTLHLFAATLPVSMPTPVTTSATTLINGHF